MNIIKYFTKPAKWYQFWLPQSGFYGGLVLACVMGFLAWVIMTIIMG